ncbi:rod shape-determining protein MreC [Paenibacillus montanisoli]|uniref:Cell shape-determining protein MreC n=1 Tax=Paenibacillus montanisoli TaxID=2081970 RepID=A0A328UBZ3_9BACL|nr:rod shape-determining protein MreC [Paenibacillus montanisoli]RAP77864.1 rod shape-determining protein MreC [Paenibacillus montanisoli]
MRNRRMFVLMIVFILFVAVMGFSIGDRKKLTWPENFSLDSTAFVQEWIYRPAGYVSGLFKDLANLHAIYKENEELRKVAAAYARDSIKYNFMDAENKRLQEKLHFTERQKQLYNYEYKIAQVIAVNNDPYSETIRINLGSKDGIKPNMVVVTDKGLVGLVNRVDPFFSSVMPITKLSETSPDTKAIAATVLGKETESFGIVDNFHTETGKLTMSRISEHDPLAKGDTIITSGLGNVFPRGVVIGTVDSSQVGDFGLTYTATITPAADFDHLTEVFVVVQMSDMGESGQ